MVANVETMFSGSREVPWHNLGVIVDNCLDSTEAIKMTGLDWNVTQHDIYTYNNRMDRFGAVAGLKANIRDSDEAVLGVVSNRYKVIQNSESFSFVDSLLSKGSLATNIKYETAGSLAGGKRIWLLAKMPAMKLVGDETIPYLCFTNSHDGSGSGLVIPTPVRVVCQNTLHIAIAGAKRSWAFRHTGDIQAKMDEAIATLELANDYFGKLQIDADILAQVKINDSRYREIKNILLPIPEREADNGRAVDRAEQLQGRLDVCYNMPDLSRFKGTGWGIVNAVSDFATHTKPQRITPRTQEILFEKVLGGHDLIDKAHKLVMPELPIAA